MTGRELIIYILSNGLEDEPLFENGRVLGFMTMEEAAAKMDVGVATIFVWVTQRKLKHIMVGGKIYIPANSVNPMIN